MDSTVRKAIARIDATIGPGDVKRGAGALVGRDLVLTALHVVADREREPIRKASLVRITFPGFETTAELIEGAWDAHLDFALLRLKDTYPESTQLLDLSPAVEAQDAWASYGFPDAQPDGLAVTGRVVMPREEHKGAPAIQLDCTQAGAGIGLEVSGLSGAPCLVQGRIVGVICRSLLRPSDNMREVNVGGVLYACPAVDIIPRIAVHLPPPSSAIVAPLACIKESTAYDLHKLARALLQAGAPPSLMPLFPDAPIEAQRALAGLATARRTVTTSEGDKKLSVAISELLANDHLHHLVVALPGSGKTHMLWSAAQELLTSGRQIPLFLAAGAAATWSDLVQDIHAIAPGIDIQAVFGDPRVCVLLDGWSEFASGHQPRERVRAIRALSNTRVIANGRRGQELDARFRVWNLDPLAVTMVARAIRTALPRVPPPPAAFTELLRLPLALSLYILLGGAAVTRGELLTRLHEHLSHDFPENFRDALAGAVASVSLSSPERSRARLEHELQARAVRTSLSNPKALLARLGTLEQRGNVVLPIHDLYWSWLSGLGLLAEDQIDAWLPQLSSRESIELALESGARPTGAMISFACETDAILAAQLSSCVDSHNEQKVSLERMLQAMLSDDRPPVRCRGAIAALYSRSEPLLKNALGVLAELREAKLYVHAFDTALDPAALFKHRGVLGEWIGSHGTDQVIDAIAERGDARWGTWFEQLANAGKLSIPTAVGAALACEARVSSWARAHLPTLIRTESYQLRAAAKRGANVELARWVAAHYAEYADGSDSTGFHLNDVLVGCDDDSAFSSLLDSFLQMPHKAQELLCFGIARRGDPWLSRFQRKAFESGGQQFHYELRSNVSLEIDDATARNWIANGPSELGWRVLIARYGNSVVPEMVGHLPASFENLHFIHALSAMRYLSNAPESLVEEIWQRVRGHMMPRAMEDVIAALSNVRLKGIPSLVGQMSRGPFFLPTYHLMRFLQHLRRWEAENHLSFQVQTNGRGYSLTEWLLLTRMPRDRNDHFFLQAVQDARDLVINIALTYYNDDEKACIRLLSTDGLADGYHEGLFEYLVADPVRAGLIPKVFSRAFDTFPEQALLRLLDTPGIDFISLLTALGTSSSPVHERLHGEIVTRVLHLPTNLFMHRDVAKVLHVHTRDALLRLLRNAIPVMTSDATWLVRAIEQVRGELLINERGDWLS